MLEILPTGIQGLDVRLDTPVLVLSQYKGRRRRWVRRILSWTSSLRIVTHLPVIRVLGLLRESLDRFRG